MGVFTDNMQALNRGFVSERAEKKALQKKKNAYKNFLYIKFYNKFYERKEHNPENVFAYYQQPEVIQNIICTKKFDDLDGFLKIELYNSILNKTFKTFKNNYMMNISTEKAEKEDERERQRLLKELEKAIERRDKAKARYEREKIKYNNNKQKLSKIINNGFGQIALGLFIGGRVASKTYRKMKY